ncbi:hypothetical protein BDQ17DRAFT_1439988 [Cyathus striatus]|nr:hypothetical protein BDQ17DRAFT_1439988 [Cyathus striatus]
MPSIQPGAKFLVSGANGYLAMWIIQKLLDHGYSVCGTVHSVSKGSHLEEYFKSYGDRFKIAIVCDFTEEGAFEKSLVGMSAVIHPATPIPSPQLENPDSKNSHIYIAFIITHQLNTTY